MRERLARLSPPCSCSLRRGGARRRAHLALLERRRRSRRTARSRSPRRSTSTPSTTASITASIATSRPDTAARTAPSSMSASRFDGATLDGESGPGLRRTGRQRGPDQARRPRHEVAVGAHEYVIRYRATREIGRFADFDEIYWNVTGNGWIFPIDEAMARIRLPRRSGSASAACTPGREVRPPPTPRWSRRSPARSRSAPPARSTNMKG